MNKIKILAVASIASIAFAGGNLWDFPNLLVASNAPFFGQVHTPGAIFCWDEVTPSGTNGWGKPCFDGTGGWWFGYADNGGAVKDAISNNNVFVPTETCDFVDNPTPEQSIGSIAVEKYIESAAGTSAGQNTAWIPLAINHSTSPGHYYVKNYGLGNATEGFDVNFVNPAGTDEEPTVSAIGFNWREKGFCKAQGKDDYQKIYTEDLSVKTGLCVVYKADKVGVDVELGWNENRYEYNTWVARLPIATSFKTLNMKWDKFEPSFESEDAPYPLNTALTEAEALKFAFKNKTSSPVTIHFQLKEVGWYGSCSGTAEEYTPPPTPIIGGKMASAYKFNMNGRMLSANFAASVQVINLQGTVVAKKTLVAGESFNLANLPAGVYMVRSEKPGIVQKIMVK